MSELKKAKDLFESAELIRNKIVDHKEQTLKNSVDKHKLKFVNGNGAQFVSERFNMCLENYTGNYGSSSCYTGNLGKSSCSSEIQEAFVSWCNKNMQTVFNGIAEELEIQAQQYKDKALKEIEDKQKLYRELFGE